MILNCIIIDDEYLAQNVLIKYIEKFQDLNLVAKCSTAIEAISILNTHKIDLIFLDINMPEISGLEMLKMLEHPPKVILTTAYSEFALESYDFGVVDYLLKPIPFHRFVKAVNRAFSVLNKNESISNEKLETNLVFKQNGVFHNVLLENILFIEAFGNYINVHTISKKILVREKLHIIEKQIPSSLAARCHKSYIVFINKISKIEGNRIFINAHKIPIGATYKLELMKKLNKNTRS